MNKLKLLVSSLIAMLAFAIFAVTGIKVNAGTTNTTYTLDAKVGTIADVKQSTAGYFTAAKDGGSASIGGGNCTATFTSIIDGNSYTAVKQTSTVDGIQGIKMESKTTITFTTTVNSTSTVTVLWGNNSSGKNGTTIKFDGTASTNSVDGLTATTTQTWSNVTAGSHTIAAGTNQATVFEIKVVETVTTAEGTYTVTYNKNGHGSNVDPDQGVTTLANPLPTLSETGYTFGGWYTDSGLSTPAEAGAAISADTTLYAKWDVNTSEWCTITFDSNGGSEVESTTQIYGSTYTLPNCTKSGYYLTGWSDGNSTFTGTYTVPQTSTKTLTAVWGELIAFDESCYFTKASSDNIAASSNSMFTVSGNVNTNSDAAVIFNGETYSTPLKMESNTSVTFNIIKPATIYIAFTSATGNCNIQELGDAKATKYTATNGVLILDLKAGNYTISKANTNNIGFIGLIYEVPTATIGTAVGTYNDGNTAIAFIVRLENVEDVTLLDAMAFTVKATFNEKVGNAKNYPVTTCYEELTAFGDVNNYAAVDGTYYVYFTVYGITSGYSGMELNVTFNATYDGSAITANKTYTYNA